MLMYREMSCQNNVDKSEKINFHHVSEKVWIVEFNFVSRWVRRKQWRMTVNDAIEELEFFWCQADQRGADAI